MILTIAGIFFALCTLSMTDMAIGVHRRHGLQYALGEYVATLIFLMMTVIVLWVEYGPA